MLHKANKLELATASNSHREDVPYRDPNFQAYTNTWMWLICPVSGQLVKRVRMSGIKKHAKSDFSFEGPYTPAQLRKFLVKFEQYKQILNSCLPCTHKQATGSSCLRSVVGSSNKKVGCCT